METALRTVHRQEDQHPHETGLTSGRLTVLEADFRNVYSIDLDPTFSSLEDTEQREQEGGFPTPRPPANTDLLLSFLYAPVLARMTLQAET